MLSSVAIFFKSSINWFDITPSGGTIDDRDPSYSY